MKNKSIMIWIAVVLLLSAGFAGCSENKQDIQNGESSISEEEQMQSSDTLFEENAASEKAGEAVSGNAEKANRAAEAKNASDGNTKATQKSSEPLSENKNAGDTGGRQSAQTTAGSSENGEKTAVTETTSHKDLPFVPAD